MEYGRKKGWHFCELAEKVHHKRRYAEIWFESPGKARNNAAKTGLKGRHFCVFRPPSKI